MHRLAVLLVLVVLAARCGPSRAPPPPDTGWQVGTSSRSVLPTVDGGHGYASPERLPLDAEADDPGVFAAQFDQGPIAVGNGKVQEDGKVRPLDVKAGDRILFSKYAGTEIKIDGEEHLIMREDDLMGIVEG